ncbi:MAG: carboxypeptidase-like regulatory domain-containing protein [Saprospiraceae bacterium]|nr:carboxypeptidase-like regulatory domain-containing protein [Saprospiraceae bacterium]
MYYHFFPFNRLFFLLLAFATLFCWQCRKAENSTIIKGRVVAYGTNEPIAGARIYLLCYSGQIFGPTSSSFVDSLVTDDNGAFFAEFAQGELCGSIYLSAFKEGYHFKRDIDIVTGVNDLEVVLDPEAWLKIRCMANQGQTSVSFQVLNYANSISNFMSSDTTFSYLSGVSIYGNRWQRIGWKTSPNQVYHQDSIFITGLDTTIYTIQY